MSLEIEDLIDCINLSRVSVKVCVPSQDYYARRDDWIEDTIQYIDPDTLIVFLREKNV